MAADRAGSGVVAATSIRFASGWEEMEIDSEISSSSTRPPRSVEAESATTSSFSRPSFVAAWRFSSMNEPVPSTDSDAVPKSRLAVAVYCFSRVVENTTASAAVTSTACRTMSH